MSKVSPQDGDDLASPVEFGSTTRLIESRKELWPIRSMTHRPKEDCNASTELDADADADANTKAKV